MPRRATLLATALLLACATARPVKDGRGAIFYPPLPNPPRLQYLASFSSAADVGRPRSGFAEFIAGEDPKKKDVVRKPYGAAMHGGKIFAADSAGGGYAVFDVANHGFAFVTGQGPGQMRHPLGIAVDADGSRYVADIGRNQVLVFDAHDAFVRAYGVEGQFKPGAVAVWKDRLYVSDLKSHQVHVLDRSSGATLATFGRSGGNEGEFAFPTNLAIGPGGDVYVTDTMNFRVQRFTGDGKFVRSYGSIGVSPGQFSRPKGVAVDREGRLYVADAAFENVQILDVEGRPLLFFGAPGGSPESVNLPAALVVDYDDVPLFQRYAAPGFHLEYLVLVVNQFGSSKLNVYGFGRLEGVDYDAKSAQQAGK